VGDVLDLKAVYGFSGFPITENGKLGSKLLGIVTNRDIAFITDRKKPLKEVMTRDLVVGDEKMSFDEATQLLVDSKKAKLPIVNSNYELVGLMSRSDLLKNRDFPYASKDQEKRLLVAAAIGTKFVLNLSAF
jgi:IMP dehydrogenase